MRFLYRMLLRLYPRRFRSEFSQEMFTTFESLWREKENRAPICRFLFTLREVAGLVRGICDEQIRFTACSRAKYPVSADEGPGASHDPDWDEIAALEQRVRFHLSQTIDCIANHRFEGARFHAAEEDRARGRLRSLQASRRPGTSGGEM